MIINYATPGETRLQRPLGGFVSSEMTGFVVEVKARLYEILLRVLRGASVLPVIPYGWPVEHHGEHGEITGNTGDGS